MIRPAGPGDAPVLERFLARHADGAMFLRSALHAHGPGGGASPQATRFWWLGSGAEVQGVVGLTSLGMLNLLLPDALAAHLPSALAGRSVTALGGPDDCVASACAALRLPIREAAHHSDEPLLALELQDLVSPDAAALRLRRPAEADLSVLTDWRGAYLAEVLNAADLARARSEIDGLIAADRLRVLVRDGQPVAMTAFNAALPEIVQIGNVYTPPDRRGQGLARIAVALHLQEARRAGVRRAVLFASGPAARRAYEALGFRRVGRYTLLFFADRKEIAACP